MQIRHILLASLFCGPMVTSCNGAPADRPSADADSVSTSAVLPSSADSIVPAPARYPLDKVIFQPSDSIRVEALLAEEPTDHDVLFYARRFKGIPYVAATLEVADPERLVVNLRQLDCTTLVETSLALALTRRQGGRTFAEYCRNLERLRYFGGKMDGYLSRLHYFTWWMHDNMKKGLITEVTEKTHFTTPIRVDNHYMSRHPEKYPLLVAHPEWTDSIRTLERAMNGPDGTYLAESLTSLPRAQLSVIENGDLIAIVTRKDGVDYSHLGFAVWGKDDRLHLLNASSIHHKVVEEPKTLRKYLSEHPSSIGIRVFRLKR